MRRLRTRAQFQALLRTPPVARTAHFVLHCVAEAAPSDNVAQTASASVFLPAGLLWLGAMTPKRCARRAVTRNAIRRQIYALGEQLEPALEGQAYLVRLRAAYSPNQFPSARSEALRQAVRAELIQLFKRVQAACAPR